MSTQDDIKHPMELKVHWDRVYSEKSVNAVSWFQTRPDCSVRFLQKTGVDCMASIIDIGGGASTLVDALLLAGYENLTVLDISETALCVAKSRLDKLACRVSWLVADVTKAALPAHNFDVWHDRAVFHFLTSSEDRSAYIKNILHSVKPNGHVIIATFAEDGPVQCSGLQVVRYSPSSLHKELGQSFDLVRHEKELHHTPSGKTQQFIYCYFRILSHAFD